MPAPPRGKVLAIVTECRKSGCFHQRRRWRKIAITLIDRTKNLPGRTLRKCLIVQEGTCKSTAFQKHLFSRQMSLRGVPSIALPVLDGEF
jgi:hypothetical protein